MTLQKITIHNGVKYIHAVSKCPCENFHDHKPKTASHCPLENKTKNFHKIFNKNITGEGFRIRRWIMNCYF